MKLDQLGQFTPTSYPHLPLRRMQLDQLGQFTPTSYPHLPLRRMQLDQLGPSRSFGARVPQGAPGK